MNVKDLFKDNASIILDGLGICGFISAEILISKQTPVALELCKENKVENGTLVEKAKVSWKAFLWPAVLTCGSIACVVAAHRVDAKKLSGWIAACQLSQAAVVDLKNATTEVVGEKNVKKIEQKIAEKKCNAKPLEEAEIINTGFGSTLCFDAICGRYFRSDISKIKEGVNAFNAKLVEDDYESLNDLYYELHLPDVGIGNILGWNMMKLVTRDNLLHPIYTSMNADDGTPVFVIQLDSDQLPTAEYDSVF